MQIFMQFQIYKKCLFKLELLRRYYILRRCCSILSGAAMCTLPPCLLRHHQRTFNKPLQRLISCYQGFEQSALVFYCTRLLSILLSDNEYCYLAQSA